MNNEPRPVDSARPSRPFTLAWVLSTLLLGGLFVFFAVPMASAESGDSQSEDDARRYAMIMQNVFDFIRENYVDDIDPKLLYEGAMQGMFEALEDPYSTFLAESDMSDLNDTTRGSFGGVGLYINKQIVPPGSDLPSFVEVASPIEDTPGWKAGINPGDLIIEIEGASTGKMSMEEVLANLRGVPGTDVTILIRRGEKLEFPVTLTRAIIEVPTVKSAMIGDIGYLRLTTFTPNTAERSREAIAGFTKSKYKGLILDLRNNYGGLLQSAIDICDIFLDGGVVVSTRSRISGDNVVFNATRRTLVNPRIPVVVLINRGSASASEIVAGALKDRGRAILVGEKSYGKGSVQQVYPLGSTGFKLTTARYYTPSDVNIDKIGIPPDREILVPELSDEEVESFSKLLESGRIRRFVKENPTADAAAIAREVKAILATYPLSQTLVSRLLRDEFNRTVIAPVYDLEYDIQLKAAVDLFGEDDWDEVLSGVKSLKQLQDEHLLEIEEEDIADEDVSR